MISIVDACFRDTGFLFVGLADLCMGRLHVTEHICLLDFLQNQPPCSKRTSSSSWWSESSFHPAQPENPRQQHTLGERTCIQPSNRSRPGTPVTRALCWILNNGCAALLSIQPCWRVCVCLCICRKCVSNLFVYIYCLDYVQVLQPRKKNYRNFTEDCF